jgi:hypothetical protein
VIPHPGGMAFKMEKALDLPPASVTMPLTIVVMLFDAEDQHFCRSGS